MIRHIRALAAGLAVATAAASLEAQPSAKPASYSALDSLSPPGALAALISLRLNQVALRDAVNDVAQRARVGIVFDPTLPALGRTISIDVQQVSAARVLVRLLDGTD